MADPAPLHDDGGQASRPADDGDAPVSPADVESAGRSCLVIIILGIAILLLVCVWIGLRSTAGG